MEKKILVHRSIFGILWVGLIVYSSLFAPNQTNIAMDLIQSLFNGSTNEFDPIILALFNIMGVWPFIYGGILLLDGKEQKIPSWIFVIASMGLGAFVLFPFLVIRKPTDKFRGSKGRLKKGVDSKWYGIVLLIISSAILIPSLINGSWAVFFEAWKTDSFVNVMSLDFLALCIAFPILIAEDNERRDMQISPAQWVIFSIPLLGALIYLSIRTPIMEKLEDVSQNHN